MKLTNRVLYGLLDACVRSSVELEAIVDDAPEYAEEYDRVTAADQYVRDLIDKRATARGISYNDWVAEQEQAVQKRIERQPRKYEAQG